MEYAVYAASSDSEDATTELEDERVASNTGQQDPLFEVAAESTSDAQGSSGFSKLATPRKSWDSFDVLKVEASEKPNHKDIQNLIHFAKNDGNEIPVPGGVHSTLVVNGSEETGLSYGDLEDHTMQTVCENDEQELVTEEDFVETTEEVKFHSNASEIGISQKPNPRRSEVQRKRNLSGGQNQASKLVKRSEQPQKVQTPHEGTGCGESAPDKTPCQRSENFQASHLEGKIAAKEPMNLTQSTELSSPSSELVKRQEVNIGAVSKYKCHECGMNFLKRDGLRIHIRGWHKVEQLFTCSKCNKIFDSMLLLDWHFATAHNVFGRITCLECGKVCPNQLALDSHQCANNVIKPVSFPCTECSVHFSSFSKLFRHRTSTHQSPFK